MFVDIANLATKPSSRDDDLVDTLSILTELIHHRRESRKGSITGRTLKAIIGRKNEQDGTPTMIHGRYTSTEEFYLNKHDFFYQLVLTPIPLFTTTPPTPSLLFFD